MNRDSHFGLEREYKAPTVEIVTVVIERGFAASYGDEGAAGGGFGDGGDYEL